MAHHRVPIIDEEAGVSYIINLSAEEYESAATDNAYLLNVINNINNEEFETEESAVAASGSNVGEQTDSWNNDSTLTFISEYEVLHELIEKGKLKQKDAFQQISMNLKQNRPPVTRDDISVITSDLE